MMHILDFLDSTARNTCQVNNDPVRVEYRLVCSGELFPANVLCDWTGSDVARILLQEPIELLVASRPYDSYPQELVLRFTASLVNEGDNEVFHIYRPDQEIASDFAALLPLLCRRLTTVAMKTREQYYSPEITPILADFPTAAATAARVRYWAARPVGFVYSLRGVQIRSYHPPPQAFDSTEIRAVLFALPRWRFAPAVLRAARLYALAMELIESQVEMSYQLFVSAVETLASAVLKDWSPDDQGKLVSKDHLVSYAMKKEGLSKEQAERLALEACKGNPWSARKFKKFLLDNLNRESIKGEDDLFVVPQKFCPKDDRIEEAISEVYKTRSGMTHGGRSYPASAAIGPLTSVPVKAFDAISNMCPSVPPIGWFERVVNNSVCNFLRRQLASGVAEEPSAP